MLNQNLEASKKLIPYSISFEQNEAEMSLTEHLEEVRQRAFWSLSLLLITIISCVLTVKNIVKLLQEPATGIKFLQLAPGEYFFASLKVAVYTGFFISSPFIIYQIILFILPGMTRGERKTLLPVVVGSVILFIFGLACGYFFLAPAALNFFINYGSDVVEPFWSFEQYFEFILVLLFSTGLAFQLPVIQVVLGSLKIFSSRLMFSVWRYVILGSTIIGAILTPSVDPVTQIFMSSIIMVLYFGGAGLVYLIERSQSDTQTA
jgi:sec-independent protein translocase protein TatC|uniref:Sec-independent translocase component C n=1 Tax=Teleaulax amphioxeia TaxID=77931 RepID=A0A0H4T332_9CRYP|nr:Sec-independent translocase component C [Teleaulax amphioxeia]AKP94657.1 Sec-independent translocase component C [Teleaulax amphioxeia]|tara:strand:- start:5200 stop:5985 length:786 start_codon:yes stop_codon:yes gene_type:complete